MPFIVAELGRDADPFMLHLYAAREKERRLSCEEGARRKARYSRNIVDAGALGRTVQAAAADQFASNVLSIIRSIQSAGPIGIVSTAKLLNERGVRTARHE